MDVLNLDDCLHLVTAEASRKLRYSPSWHGHITIKIGVIRGDIASWNIEVHDGFHPRHKQKKTPPWADRSETNKAGSLDFCETFREKWRHEGCQNTRWHGHGLGTLYYRDGVLIRHETHISTTELVDLLAEE